MLRYPDPDEVFDRLGDKIVRGLGQSVRLGGEDLERYRTACPDLAARHGRRGLANILHDYIWPHLEDVFDDLDEVVLRDDGTTRELMIQGDFRIRVKKHSQSGAITSYRTQSALDFVAQDEDLFGLRRWNLAVGYVWDSELAAIEMPVVSLRDGDFSNPIWMEEMPALGVSAVAIRAVHDAPPQLGIETPRRSEEGRGSRQDA